MKYPAKVEYKDGTFDLIMITITKGWRLTMMVDLRNMEHILMLDINGQPLELHLKTERECQ